MEVERNWTRTSYTFICEDETDKEFLDKMNKYIDKLEEENKALKITVDENKLLAKDYVELEEENRKLKESLDIATKCSSKEEDGIIRLSEENRLLKNEIAWLKDHTKYNGITEEHYIDGTMTATEAKLRLQQAEDNKNYISKLEEENKKLSEENGQLKEENEELKIWLREKLPLALLKEYMAKFEGFDESEKYENVTSKTTNM